MTEHDPASIDATTRRLVEKLKTIRASGADSPEDERRSAFENAVQGEVGAFPAETADTILSAVKRHFVEEARSREARVTELTQQVGALNGQLQSLSAECERLRKENEQLQRQSKGSAAPSSAGGMDKLRQGLLEVSRGQDVTAESIGVDPADGRLFSLVRSLFDFALKYELGLNFLLAELKIGPAGDADSLMRKGLQDEVRGRFRACLENKEGSLQALKETLDRNAKFLVDLNRSYQACLYEGNHSMLDRLDPRPILEKHKRVLGSDFEAAWKTISRVQADLFNLSSNEMWEQFFLEPFQEKLGTYQT